MWFALALFVVLSAAQEDKYKVDPALVLKPIAPPGHATGHISTLHPRSEGKHFWTPNGERLGELDRDAGKIC